MYIHIAYLNKQDVFHFPTSSPLPLSPPPLIGQQRNFAILYIYEVTRQCELLMKLAEENLPVRSINCKASL